MTIRRAVTDDVSQLVELAREEHAASFLAHTPFDAEHAAANFHQVINGMAGVVLVSEVDGQLRGLIAGIAQQNLHNRYASVYELMWYARDGSGMKLLAGLRDWANRMRATRMVVHNYAGTVPAERFTRAMARKGFVPLGMSYTVELEN